jgi:2-C-methyl-D-erythritol 4-phosphate cytidylyltransferase
MAAAQALGRPLGPEGFTTPAQLGLIVVAAGRGSLAALARPPVERVVLVVAAARLTHGRALAAQAAVPAIAVVGGARRQDSVRAGLAALGPCTWVAVHDAARPFADHTLLLRTLEAARATGAAVAAVPVQDTIKRVRDGRVVETLARAELWAVQTPQVFRGALLARAHEAATAEATDDAALVERLGVPVAVATGAYVNIKVTTPDDLVLARLLWQQRAGAAAGD